MSALPQEMPTAPERMYSREELDAALEAYHGSRPVRGLPPYADTPRRDYSKEQVARALGELGYLAGGADQYYVAPVESPELLSSEERYALRSCATYNINTFYPEKGDAYGIEAAKKICKSCVWRDDCLEEALSNQEDRGVWGGLSERERRALLRRHPRLGRSRTR
jgi:WhiB family redox-sensing transcriptional regulator